jgi:hypothetical protein
MRVGFLRQLLWPRYGEVWVKLLQNIEVEVQFADPTNVVQRFETLADIPGVPFRLAVAEALALVETDTLIVPDLNAGETVARGSGQNPWIVQFPEALQRVAGLPLILKVPATLEGNLEPLVLETLLSFKRDPAKVRLSWERYQKELNPKRYPEPRWTKQPGQTEVVGVIGQPWLVTQQLLGLLETSHSLSHKVSQYQLSPALLREEAKRLEQRLIASDAEVLGAAHFFNRKGSVDRILMLVDTSSGADLWLEKQVRKIVTKPLEIVYLQNLIGEHGVGVLLISS